MKQEPIEIKRIDLLVHPFFSMRFPETMKFRLEMWERHVDEVAADPHRLLAAVPIGGISEAKETRQLLSYARKKLRKRFFLLEPARWARAKNGGVVSLKDFLESRGFAVNPGKVVTRGFGEFTHACVFSWLTGLNKTLGMPNPIPYRNRQSTVMPRKSVAGGGEYFMPWDLPELKKSAKARAAEIGAKMQHHSAVRLLASNVKAIELGMPLFELRQPKKAAKPK